ncbi:MAG: YHS domain-containing protein [Gemmatimonadota bacterium]|nr:YHS domain-containing protein [Gemmatimonadota bacterium]
MSDRALVADPVCGMLILPERAAGTRLYADAVYHLCSVGCLRKFDADAAAYVAASRVDGFRTWVATEFEGIDRLPNDNPESHDRHSS